MRNERENYKIEGLTITLEKASRSLHNTLRYIYALSVGDFYNVNVKDLFKISLSDISNSDVLSNLGISPSNALDDENFELLDSLFFFAFAVRLPFLNRQFPKKEKIKDRFLREVYESCVSKGAADENGVLAEFGEDFKRSLKLAKSSRTEPPFNGEWLRRWIYAFGGAELSAITNKNMFVLGCMDALIPLYYAKLMEILAEEIRRD
ncbi:MAG: hypothetical protein FWG83_05905 [Oscillospiraceae bacterium]|nr:hypothetical protein [Oscillospiraceae bacterium]